MFTEALTSRVLASDGVTHVLQWDSDGLYEIGESDWKNVEIETTMIYKGGQIGIIPRYYSPYAYMYFTVGKTTYSTDVEGTSTAELHEAGFYIYLDGNVVELGKKELTAPLVEGSEYKLKAVVDRYNYKIYINNELYFNVEYGGETSGSAHAYATSGNQCRDVSISSAFPDGWTSNVSEISGATVYVSELANEDDTIRLENPTSATTDLSIEQVVSVTSGANAVFHGRYLGQCSIALRFIDGAQSGTETIINGDFSDVWKGIEGKATIPSDCTSVAVIFYVAPGGEAKINDAQVEYGDSSTSYIHNDSTTDVATRNESFLTFPAKEIIDNEEGVVSMWVRPSTAYDATLNKSYMLIQYGDSTGGISIYGVGDTLYAEHGGTSISVPATSLQKNIWYHVAMGWSESSTELYLNGARIASVPSTLYTGEGSTINIGFDEYNTYSVFNGYIDDLIIYKTKLTASEITEIYEALESIPDTGDMTLRATFNHAIGSFNRTYVEIPNAPEYGSPILVEKADGKALRKVSFLDYQTGKYKTWNEEIVIYDGDEYAQVSFDELDTDSFKVSVMDMNGNMIGEPYKVKGKRIYMTLTDDEKLKYKGQPIHARYQLEDSYTVDFNIHAADSFRVDIAKHDGQEVNVVYEGNRFSHEKLADMIELNPMLSPNHQGFMYVTKNVEPITSFKVKMTPSDLQADGASDSLIIVEPVDINGNNVCGATLSIEAEHGVIYPSLEPEAIKMRETAGRYIYRYIAPRKISSTPGTVEAIEDPIRILDKKSGIGVERYMTLMLYDDYVIQVENEQSKDTVSDELMAAYLLDKVMMHYGVSTEGQPVEVTALDFNGDGSIDIGELNWLYAKLYTTDLQDMYKKILGYYN